MNVSKRSTSDANHQTRDNDDCGNNYCRTKIVSQLSPPWAVFIGGALLVIRGDSGGVIWGGKVVVQFFVNVAIKKEKVEMGIIVQAFCCVW